MGSRGTASARLPTWLGAATVNGLASGLAHRPGAYNHREPGVWILMPAPNGAAADRRRRGSRSATDGPEMHRQDLGVSGSPQPTGSREPSRG